MLKGDCELLPALCHTGVKAKIREGSMAVNHLSDEELERYLTGMIHHDAEVAYVERHLFKCPDCEERMKNMQDALDAIQAGLRLDDEETSGRP